MPSSVNVSRAAVEGSTDQDVIDRVLAGETGAYEIIMRRYNQRLYRVALGILKNVAEAEDVMQETYVRAFEHLSQFAGRSKFSTWLTRIAVNESIARARRSRRSDSLDDLACSDGELKMASAVPNPETIVAKADWVSHLPAQPWIVIGYYGEKLKVVQES